MDIFVIVRLFVWPKASGCMHVACSWHKCRQKKRKLTQSTILTWLCAEFTQSVNVIALLKSKDFKHSQFSFKNEKYGFLNRSQVEKHWEVAYDLCFSQTFSSP